MEKEKTAVPIAVIGIACRYPDARTPRQFWENILARRRQFRQMPDQRLPLSDYYHADPEAPDKTYGRRAAVIDGFQFDWASHRVPLSTYETADIAHWLALETAIAAVADAGLDRETIPRERTGVIVGNSLTGEQTRTNAMRLRWPFVRRALCAAAAATGISSEDLLGIESRLEVLYKSVFPVITEDSLAGGLSNTISGRICSYLNVFGGGYTVDGACSSSLLSVTTAASGLAFGDLDLALAGGVDISLDTFELIGFAKTGALTARDMNVYDRRGSGFIPGEGCGFVVLKRLEDARRDGDYVYAVLHGWGISSDGKSTGLTAPSAAGQSRALARAYARAPYGMSELDFIEGHGTGTKVGDRIELEGVALAMGEALALQPVDGLRACGMTSVKSIMGHTKAASGVGGFIKAVMAVNQRVSPPTAGCRDPHPVFGTKALRLYPVLQGNCFQPEESLKAGVSAMGFGGINCHVTLASGDAPSPRLTPVLPERVLLVSNQNTELFLLSAESGADLEKKIESLRQLSLGMSMAEMADLAAKLAHEVEKGARVRFAVVVREPDELQSGLENALFLLQRRFPEKGRLVHEPGKAVWIGNQVEKKRVALLFPGQGSQKLNMAKALIERFPWAQELVSALDQASSACGTGEVSPLIFHPLDRAVTPDQAKQWGKALSQTQYAQPAICLASAIWYIFLQKMGLQPVAVGGHSLGELTAFFAAGILSAEELFQLAALRGRAMEAAAEAAGAMAGLRCSRPEAEAVMKKVTGYIVLANINGPQQVVLSGESAAVEQALEAAVQSGIQARLLPVSNAFHSKMASRAAEMLASASWLEKTAGDLKTRLFSSVTGREIQPGVLLNRHFSNQVLAQVEFMAMVQGMAGQCDLFLEVGPGRVLSGLVETITAPDGPFCFPVESAGLQDEDLNRAMANLFIHGLDLDWDALYQKRLVRPFVPAAEKVFIENPCERLLPAEGAMVMPGTGRTAEGLFERYLLDLAVLSEADMLKYMEVRGPFLAQVILADLKYPAAGVPALLPEWTPEISGAHSEPLVAKSGSPAPKSAIEPLVLSVVEKITGFAVDSLSMEMRLLDDLNLDSIKAGDLIAKISRATGLPFPAEKLNFANATLFEVVAQFQATEALSPAGDTMAAHPPDALDVLMTQAAALTGYPKEGLDADALVERDLGMGPDLLHTLIQQTAGVLHVESHMDLEPLRERSLRQIASILGRMARARMEALGDEPLGVTALSERAETAWVRDFSVEMAEVPFAPLPDWWGKRREDNWENANTLVLRDREQGEVAEALRISLLAKGAQVRIASYDEALSEGLAQEVAFSLLIAVLPQGTETGQRLEIDLEKMAARLMSIAAPPPAARAPRRRTAIAYVQFGGGYFGTKAPYCKPHQCCATALAKSVYLEREDLKVRVLDFWEGQDTESLAEQALLEINTPAPFVAVGYDHEGRRREARPRVNRPAAYVPRKISWHAEDVILVTGGGRGITASIALGLARRTGAKMALVGSSAYPDAGSGSKASEEIAGTLRQYADKGLTARYFACDVKAPEAVRALVAEIQKEMGPVTGVIHGAGLNRARPVNQVSLEEALSEVTPKVAGAINLMAALADFPPKIFSVLSSIIGFTGMPGNAWYGFSNELLEILLRRYAAERPETAVLAAAYSIWRDEGMGYKMGSVGHLKRMGIDAIASREGVDRFVRLFLNDPGGIRVIIAARLAGLDTWAPAPLPGPDAARYLEKPVHITPGVESLFQAHLTLETDPYLRDHLFNGSYLFPTVFGLEAMAQVAAHCAGKTALDRVRIEDIQLKRPITVDPETGADILIRAEAAEQPSGEGATEVRAGIIKTGAGVNEDFFSAVFLLNLEDEAPAERIDLPETALPIDPVLDLYREKLLFQGPSFQRIRRIFSIEVADNRETAAEARFTAAVLPPEAAAEVAFTDQGRRRLLLGDPYFRDALLQSAQLLVPREACLPVAIRRLDLFSGPCAEPATWTARISLAHRKEKELEDRVLAVDQEGRAREILEGYTLRVLKGNADNPLPADLIAPDDRDSRLLREALVKAAHPLGLTVPFVAVRHLEGLHQLPREQRHALERPLIEQAVAGALGLDSKEKLPVEIRWHDSGKPVVTPHQGEPVGISISHDERMCLCVAGHEPQGCDLSPVTHRSRAEWLDLLGEDKTVILDTLTDGADTLDRAGTRVWATLETVKKAVDSAVSSLTVKIHQNGTALFEAETARGSLQVLTLSILLTRGPERIVALLVRETAALHETGAPDYGYNDLFAIKHYETMEGGPQGQGIFIHRLPVTFRPNAQLSRTIYFSNYFFWLGEVREASVWPVLRKVGDQFATGRWGLVTNKTHMKILGEATAQDQIEIRLWVPGNGGPANSTMDLTFDYRKIIAPGKYQRLAWCDQQVTWVRILDHGVVRPEPYPDYYGDFMQSMLPKFDAPNVGDPLPEPLAGLGNREDDRLQYQAPAKPVVEPLLFENIIETSLDNSNIVGNIYFANYYAWQGQTRDRYFYGLIPEFFRGVGEKGELLCLQTWVHHLREAMPFDRIVVTMALKCLNTFSAVFHFEYFREAPDGSRIKLAFGEQQSIWVERNGAGEPIPAAFPSAVGKAFRDAIEKH